jgi:catechol 2,3-dioxygenase-like lactoylglutathione lyase family enzyme
VIKGLRHIGISVADLNRSIGFYRDVLGMEVSAQEVFAGDQYEIILGLDGASGSLTSDWHSAIVRSPCHRTVVTGSSLIDRLEARCVREMQVVVNVLGSRSRSANRVSNAGW